MGLQLLFGRIWLCMSFLLYWAQQVWQLPQEINRPPDYFGEGSIIGFGSSSNGNNLGSNFPIAETSRVFLWVFPIWKITRFDLPGISLPWKRDFG